MSDIKKRTFEFEQKDSYTPLEINAILGQHSEFVGGASKKELEELRTQLESVSQENQGFKSEARKRTIKKIAKEVNADNYEKLVKYANIPEDADEAAIKKIMGEVAKDFTAPVTNTTKPKEVVVTKTKIEPKDTKPAKPRRFAGKNIKNT